MQAVIMAGGKGTRLRAITNDEIPKPMAPIAGKPILEWQMECLRRQGITDVVLIIGHLGHKIREYFGDGTAFGLRLSYLEETTPLGTAGALSLLPPLLTQDCFYLIFGDVLFDIDLERMRRFHQEKRSAATLFVHPNTHPFDSDLVVAIKKTGCCGLIPSRMSGITGTTTALMQDFTCWSATSATGCLRIRKQTWKRKSFPV